MKVFFVYLSSSLDSGSSIALQNLLKELMQKQVEVYIAMPGNGSFRDWIESEKIENFRLWKTGYFTWPSFHSFFDVLMSPYRIFITVLANIVNTFYLFFLFLRISPSVIHTNNSVTVCGFLAAKLARIPHVWHLREYMDTCLGLRFIPNMKFLRYLLKKTYTVSITPDIAEHYCCNDLNKDKIIYDGVVSEKSAMYNPCKKNYFLFVGSLYSIKGCKELIDTFSLLCKELNGIELWIAGTGPTEYVEFLKDESKYLGAYNRIKFLGFRKDRYLLMSEAKALIVPSLMEGFGFITVEAMAMGCLVIGRYVGGTKLIFDNAPNCALSFNNDEEMLSCMRDVAQTDSSVYEQRIIKAQTVALDLYSIEKNSSKMFSFFSAVRS